MLVEGTNSFQLGEFGEVLRNTDTLQCTELTTTGCICRWEYFMYYT